MDIINEEKGDRNSGNSSNNSDSGHGGSGANDNAESDTYRRQRSGTGNLVAFYLQDQDGNQIPDDDGVGDFQYDDDDDDFTDEDLYASPPTLWGDFVNFWASPAGAQASMDATSAYAVTMAFVILALLLGNIFEVVSNTDFMIFEGIMYSISMVGMITLLVLHRVEKLTISTVENSKKTSFIRGGMLVLGSGGFLHGTITLAIYSLNYTECDYLPQVILNLLSQGFLFIQIGWLLSKSSVHINASVGVSHLGRVVLMQVVATNVCVWLKTIVEESLHDLHLIEDTDTNSSTHTQHYAAAAAPLKRLPPSSYLMFEKPRYEGLPFDIHNYAVDTSSENSSCPTSGSLEGIITPYTFPLLIEFCVVASGMLLAIWERCGFDNPHLEHSPSSGSLELSAELESQSKFKPHYHNNNTGLVAGWFVMISTITFVILILFDYYTNGSYRDFVEDVVYSLNMTVSAITLIAVMVTIYRMKKLPFTDKERVGIHQQVDKDLISVTFSALLAYKLMSMISAYNEKYVIVVDGLVSIVMGFVQSIFLNWFVHQVRATTAEHVMTKPGRQGLEFIRCCNIALWLINTFLLRNQAARRTQQDTFGIVAWSIISNIVQPLVILFFFHSSVSIAEVIAHNYTIKKEKKPKQVPSAYTVQDDPYMKNYPIEHSPAMTSL